MPSKRVLLVEVHRFHTFVLLPQCLLLLEAGYQVFILLNTKNPDYSTIQNLEGVEVIPFPCELKIICTIRAFIHQAQQTYDFIIFNTLPWAMRHKIFILLLPQELRFIMHQVGMRERYEARQTQRILFKMLARKAARFLYLSETTYHNAMRRFPELAHKTTYFYPNRYPNWPATSKDDDPSAGRVMFAILGEVDARRRNYQSLIDAFEQLVQSPLAEQITIRIMGSTHTELGTQLIKAAHEYSLLGTTIQLQQEQFIALPEYLQALRSSHFIIPLIDNTVEEPYNIKTAPSSLMLGRGLTIPVVVSNEFLLDEDLKPFSISYHRQDLTSGLEAAVQLYYSPNYEHMLTQYRAVQEELFQKSVENYLA